MPGMEVRLHLPDIHHGLLHIFEWNDQEGWGKASFVVMVWHSASCIADCCASPILTAVSCLEESEDVPHFGNITCNIWLRVHSSHPMDWEGVSKS
jgi:hypothetical protein